MWLLLQFSLLKGRVRVATITVLTFERSCTCGYYYSFHFGKVWYGMVFIYSTSLYIIYIAHHYNITQDAEREMHEVQYLYVAFP